MVRQSGNGLMPRSWRSCSEKFWGAPDAFRFGSLPSNHVGEQFEDLTALVEFHLGETHLTLQTTWLISI